MSKGKRSAVIGAIATMGLVAATGMVLKKECWHGTESWTCTLIMEGREGPHCRLPRVEVCATDAPLAAYFATKSLAPLPPGYTPVDMLCNQQRFQTDMTFPECKTESTKAGEGSP